MGIELPGWPRMLRREKAAAYCDLSVAAFEREVLAGRLPHPVMLGGKEHWSRVAIDNALERLSGEAPDDWRAKAPLYRERYA